MSRMTARLIEASWHMPAAVALLAVQSNATSAGNAIKASHTATGVPTPTGTPAKVVCREFVEQCLSSSSATITNILKDKYVTREGSSCTEIDSFLSTQQRIELNRAKAVEVLTPVTVDGGSCRKLKNRILEAIGFAPSDCSGFKQVRTEYEFHETDFSKVFQIIRYPNLKSLECNQCMITSLDGIEHLTGLTALTVAGNRITSLSPIKSLKALEHINISGNPIKDFQVLFDLPSLKSINAYGIEMPLDTIRELQEKLIVVQN